MSEVGGGVMSEERNGMMSEVGGSVILEAI